MKTSDYDYPLPRHLIAQTPVEPRDHSRLLVVNRADGSLQHRHFYDLPQLLMEGDLLVFNDSRVIPARLYGQREGTGGQVEVLLLHQQEPGVWEALGKPGRSLRPGSRIRFGDSPGAVAEVLGIGEGGTRILQFLDSTDPTSLGVVPLPPYIKEPLEDPERYQTVYARVKGSSAAPTAGLHFTEGLLKRLQDMGVQFAFVTLHVGMDSFRQVKEEDPTEHKLFREYCTVSQETCEAVNEAKHQGRRVIVVGTTTVRTLETAARASNPAILSSVEGSKDERSALNPEPAEGKGEDWTPLKPFAGWTDMYILPGHKFQVPDALITNFHLPRTTLLMLTCAFGGRELILKAYAEAIRLRYRLYSLGDSMMIV